MQIMACTLYVDKRNEIKSPIVYWLLYFVIEMSLFKIGAWFTLLFLEDIYNNYQKRHLDSGKRIEMQQE